MLGLGIGLWVIQNVGSTPALTPEKEIVARDGSTIMSRSVANIVGR
jgi:hypothetical protein